MISGPDIVVGACFVGMLGLVGVSRIRSMGDRLVDRAKARETEPGQPSAELIAATMVWRGCASLEPCWREPTTRVIYPNGQRLNFCTWHANRFSGAEYRREVIHDGEAL